MEKINSTICLNSESVFEYDIARALKELITDTDSFYHIYVTDNQISVEKQGYNTPALEKTVFDINGLTDDEYVSQRRDAIVATYQYAFGKTNDLQKRLSNIINMDTLGRESQGVHSFYHDQTGKYPEDMIAKRIVFLSENKLDDETIGKHR